MGGIMSTVLENCKKLSNYITKSNRNANSNRYVSDNSSLYSNEVQGGNQIGKITKICKMSKNGEIYKSAGETCNLYKPPNTTFKKVLINENFFSESSGRMNISTTRTNKNTVLEIDNLSYTNIQNRPMCQSNSNFPISRNKLEKINVVYNTKTFPVDSSLSSIKKEQKYKLDDFLILKLLGKGTFGKVLLVRNKKDNKLYAMKVLKKDKVFKFHQIDHTKTEREILEKINHPFIVKLFFAFQTDEKLYLVTEFMQGGELFFHLKKQKVFAEDKAKAYICEIILAIEHLHKNKIIYRDLKPENILLDIEGHVKLTDFGLSKFFGLSGTGSNNLSNNFSDTKSNFSNENSFNSTDKAFTLCGTPEYLAPEILTGKGYDKSVDWWSLGVLLYEMLCGTSPFKKRKRNQKLNLEYYQHPIIIINNFVSENAKNLILSLLKNDPNERLNSSILIKQHPFFKEIDWEVIINQNVTPQFIPKFYLKSDDDLCFFDKSFTETIIDKNEQESNSFGNNTFVEKNIEKNIITNYIVSNGNLNDRNLFKKMKRIREDFRNFSFTRDEGKEILK